MRAEADDFPVVHNDDKVGIFDTRRALRHGDRREFFAFFEFVQRFPKFCVGCEVERAGTVVKYKYFRVGNKGAGNGQALSLTARKVLAALIYHCVEPVFQVVDKLLGLRNDKGFFDFLVGGVLLSPADIVAHGSFKQDSE